MYVHTYMGKQTQVASTYIRLLEAKTMFFASEINYVMHNNYTMAVHICIRTFRKINWENIFICLY
jgi:coproporphyrinogen III oxidase